MKILFFEDHAQSKRMAALLKDEYEHEVYLTDRYTDLMDWLEYEPGAEAFEALFIDLNVPRISMPKKWRSIKPEVPSGWVFINEYLIKEYPFLKPRIILYSAYLELIGSEANEYHILNKFDSNIIKKMTDILEKLKK
jgi:hypothetical protein